MKRIAYVINAIKKNGPSSVVISLIHNLDRTLYQPALITIFRGNDPQIVRSLREMGVEVIEGDHDGRLGYLLTGQREFERLVRDGRFDVIHTHGFVPDVMASRIQARAKRICTIHNIMFEDYAAEYGWLKSKLYIALHLHALRKLEVCVGCSQTVADATRKHVPHIAFVRNGSDPKPPMRAVSRQELGIPTDARLYVFAGRLTERKNVRSLVRDFCRCRAEDEYLIVLGDGPDRAACESAADAHVRFLGFLDNPMDYYRIADVFTSSSRSEGFSIAMLEALEQGLGLLLSDIPSHCEVFGIDERIYLGETFADAQYGEQMAALRAHADRLDRAGIAAFKEAHLSGRCMTEAYMRLYAE